MGLITSVFGSHIGKFYTFAYWAAKLRNPDQWLSEVDGRVNFIGAAYRPYDWTMDLVTTGDILRIAELWMFCPRNQLSPEGNTARIPFSQEESGTAFMFNVARVMMEHRVDHKIIGKVTDRDSGDCVCFIWDDLYKVMSSPFYTNVNKFASWREGVAPIGQLSHEVIGLRL